MSHDGMVVLPRFSLKSWRVIGAWELGQSQKRTEERREVLAGQSHNRTEERSSGRVGRRDSLVCSSSRAKSGDKKHLGSEINQIKSNGDLGKDGDGKIWSKVESGQARGGFRNGLIDLSGLEIPKREKNGESE
jgi:hypothetical protein